MKDLKNFKKLAETPGYYAAEYAKVQAECKKFEAVAGVTFTIDNARHALLTAADSAIIIFGNDCGNPNCETFKNQFNQILDALPFNTLPRTAELIKAEILAHLELNYGGIALAWLTFEA
jgi:hypothetical protein